MTHYSCGPTSEERGALAEREHRRRAQRSFQGFGGQASVHEARRRGLADTAHKWETPQSEGCVVGGAADRGLGADQGGSFVFILRVKGSR